MINGRGEPSGMPRQRPSNVSGPGESRQHIKTCVTAMMSHLECGVGRIYKMSALAREFKIERRRLYDVVNVFEAVECCEKLGVDEFRWLGQAEVIRSVSKIALNSKITDAKMRLDDIFPCPCSVGVFGVTHCLLTMIFAVNMPGLDLRVVSEFLARDTKRYKAARYKLYQISYVLAALGVLENGANMHEIVLTSEYARLLHVNKPDPDPMSLTALLNRVPGLGGGGGGGVDGIFRMRLNELVRNTQGLCLSI